VKLEKEKIIMSNTELIDILKERFDKNMNRHEDFQWAEVQAKLEGNAEKTTVIG
jgi:hypothetical protein